MLSVPLKWQKYAAPLRDLTAKMAVASSGTLAYQAISFVAGILVIRILAIEQYALFGLSLVIGGVLNRLADAGVSQAALSIAGRLHGDRIQIGQLHQSCRNTLRRNALVGASLALPVWLYTASRHSDEWWVLVAIGIILVAGFLADLGRAIYTNLLLLQGEIKFCQAVDVAGALLRLLILVCLLWAAPYALLAVAVGSVVVGVQRLVLRRRCRKYIDLVAPFSGEFDLEVKRFMRRLFPTALYASFSQQILFFLVATSASTAVLATVAAIGRLGQVFLVTTPLCRSVFVPMLARAHGSKEAVLRYALLTALAWGIAVSLGSVFLIWPGLAEILLGKAYAGHTLEVRLFFVGATLFALTSILTLFNNTKGWLMPPWVIIPIHLGAMVIAVSLLSFRSISHYFLILIIINGASLAAGIAWTMLNMSRCLRPGAVVKERGI